MSDLAQQMKQQIDMLSDAMTNAHIAMRQALRELGEARAKVEHLQSVNAELLELAKRSASECTNCNYGQGATGLGSEGQPCEDCSDIRDVIAKTEGRS